MLRFGLRFLTLALLAGVALAHLSAQNVVHQVGNWFLRGKVTAITPASITIAPHIGGPPETVPLASGWTVGYVVPADESILAPGHVVNIVEVDWKDETPRALYVDYFPLLPTPAAPPPTGGMAGVVTKGRNWAQLPGKDEFGAWGALGKVISVDKTPAGLLVVTDLAEGPHTSLVPPGIPLVQMQAGMQDMVKVDTNAHVLLRKGPDGKPVSNRILIAANNGIPPM